MKFAITYKLHATGDERPMVVEASTSKAALEEAQTKIRFIPMGELVGEPRPATAEEIAAWDAVLAESRAASRKA